MKTLTPTIALIGFALIAGPLAAGIDGLSLGTGAPPASVGTFAVTPFTSDARPTWEAVTSVPVPAMATPSGSILFDTALTHLTIDPTSLWATWSHGYTGDVYWYDTFQVPQDGMSVQFIQADTGTFKLNLTLPTGTKAFYLYVEPGAFDTFNFDVQGFGSNESQQNFMTQPIAGKNGAEGFAFFATDPTSTVDSVAITAHDVTLNDGFAIGEFGIDGTGEARVPDAGATVLLLGLPVIALAMLRKQLAR